MDDIRQGALRFQRETFQQKKALFRQLAIGQTPEALFITCSDSRVSPTLITHSQPGQLFVDRNPGNFIPPYHGENASEAAGIEYALEALEIPAIIICGHSDCGAMKGVLHPLSTKKMPAVRNWLKNGGPARARLRRLRPPAENQLEMLTQLNVVQQLANLRTYPVVTERIAAGKLMLAGWVYDIARGKILELDQASGEFHPLRV